MKKYNINGLDIIIKNNPKTPRMAIGFDFLIDRKEKYAGTYSLFARLLVQGTKKYSAQELALIFENNGISLNTRQKQDYFHISTLFLNEDCDLALDLLAEVIENSTFEEFEKEVHKLKGDIKSDLDHPQTKARVSFISEFFKGHYYGNTYVKTLDEVDNITREDVAAVLEQIMSSKKSITVVGDIDEPETFANRVAEKFAFLKSGEDMDELKNAELVSENKVIKIEKNDVQQAQIIQGWNAASIGHEDYPGIVVMNNILGSSGLSSRLFIELRDKKGLAYTVRSSFEALRKGSLIYLYIATDPKNIKASLEGFEVEIKKLQTELVDEIELQGAKENVLGRLEYFLQTNAQQASTIGYDWVMGLGLDFEEKYRKMINGVSAQDIIETAQKYFSKPSITAILAPKENLEF